MKKLITIYIILMIILTQLCPINAVQVNTKNLDFHVYLAKYLDQNYLYDKLNQPMAHQFFNQAMQEEFGEHNTALTLTYMANDWGKTIQGKSGIYEEVLLEMLVNHINSDVFKERVNEDKVKIEDEIMEFIKKSFEFDSLLTENKQLHSVLTRIDFKSWKDISKIPDKVFNENIMKLVKHFELPISDNYLLNAGYDTYDFLMKIITYKSICYQIEGIQSVLEEMLHYSDNADLHKAIETILKKIDAARSPDLWELIEESDEELFETLFADLVKDILISSLSIIGLAIETGGFISNAVFKTDVVAETYLLLDTEIEIENLIKNIISSKQNTYIYNKEDARILTYSTMFLYDAYEYGTQLVKNYGESIYKAIGQLFGKDLYIKFFQNCLHIDLNKKTYSYNDFTNMIKTWEGIIDNDRTLFESGWIEYKDTYIQLTDSIEDIYNDPYYNYIYFENQYISVELEDASFSYPLTSCKTAPHQIPITFTYTSSNPEIVSIENEHIYSIKAHKTGSVVITAVSEDGLYTASQHIQIIDSNIQVSDEIHIEEDLSECYEFNEDGITLTKLSPKFLSVHSHKYIESFSEKTRDYYALEIPTTINGHIVTELDFEDEEMLYYRDTLSIVDKIIIPGNVKRIADGGLSCLPRKCEVILNEGLEEIGNHAFGDTIFTNKDLVLPSTVKSIGTRVFSGLNSIYINCPELQTIPSYCLSNISSIYFSNEMKQLKTIEKYGLCNNGTVYLPDCVEVLEESALSGSTIPYFPDQLKSIGKLCFEDSVILADHLPETLETIGEYAFTDIDLNYMYIPNTIKHLHKDALEDISQIYTYGETLTSNGIIEDDLGWYDYFEIPSSITDIKEDLYAENLVWTNGINTISCPDRIEGINYEEYYVNLYLNEIDRNGSYELKNHIFSLKYYFNYIEIPVNYLNNTTHALYGDWIKDCVIVGEASEEDLARYVEVLKDAIDVGGTITYRTQDGELILLYQYLPLTYEKESLCVNENQDDFIINPLTHLQSQITDTVSDLKITLSHHSSISGLSLSCWNDQNESEYERNQELGDFITFEDVYLKQPFYRYFTINHSSSYKGPYRISIELDELTLNASLNNKTIALYHISDTGKITRIPISYQKNYIPASTIKEKTEYGYTSKYIKETRQGIITFETQELGQFALVQLVNKTTTIPCPYRDGYLYQYEEKTIDQDNSITYKTNEGSVSITSDQGTSTVVKKEEKDTIYNQLVKEFDIGNQVIYKDDLEDHKYEELVINEEYMDDIKLWEELTDHSIVIKSQSSSSIQIALDQLFNQKYQFYLYEITEDQQLVKTKININKLKESKANILIQQNNKEYYKINLKDNKQYLLTYTIEEQTKQYHYPIIFIIIIICILFIIKKKGKRL